MGSITRREKYAEIVLSIVPRILSSIDDNLLSDTYGCVDKAYWFYKTKDFPCSRLQEAGLTLALLYFNKFKGNIYYNQPRIKELAIAALDYTIKIQHKDGSFDEWYPNEHSFCATAFVTYSMSEVCLQLGIKEAKYLHHFEKGVSFLMKTKEDVANQQAGSLIAIYNLYLLTNNKKFINYSKRKLAILSKLQSEEGWFAEYGSADIGYLTVTLDCLGKYYSRSKDLQAFDMAKKALDFLKYFIHPDGSLGGVYGSRGAEFKFPHGLEIFSRYNEDAAYLAKRIYDSIDDTLNPAMMDDRYALVYNVSYLQACITPGIFKDRMQKDKIKLFKHSGLYIVDSKDYYFVCNLNKGGVYTIFRNGIRKDDSGIFVRQNGRLLTSQWQNSSRYMIEDNKIFIKGYLHEMFPIQRLSPMKNAVFRLFLSTIGRNAMIAQNFKTILRKLLILKSNKTSYRFERKIYLDKFIKVIDMDFKGKIISSSNIKTNYVPTSRFWNGEL